MPKSNELTAKNRIDWNSFIKIEILQELIPVIEFNEFLEHISNELDLILILNRFNENEKNSTSQLLENGDCKHIQFYEKDNHIYGLFYGFKDYMKGKKMLCMNIDGDGRIIESVLHNELKHIQSVFIQNVDLISHSQQDDKAYWLLRRSIQFTDSIRKRANKFRRKYFDSDDEKDKTFIGSDWQSLEKLNKAKQSEIAIGGDYIAAHWLVNQNNQLDDRIVEDRIYNELDKRLSKDEIVKQILIALKKTNSKLVFVATDGDDKQWIELNDEFNSQLEFELKDQFKLLRYRNKSNKLPSFEFELIEQWICSHARLFIGTSNSMFTRLIQEQREILGFNSTTTFNLFCAGQSSFCDDKVRKINY